MRVAVRPRDGGVAGERKAADGGSEARVGAAIRVVAIGGAGAVLAARHGAVHRHHGALAR